MKSTPRNSPFRWVGPRVKRTSRCSRRSPFPVRIASAGWSPPTADGGINADVIDVGAGDEAGFAKTGARVKGAIVLIHTQELKSLNDLLQEYYQGPAIVDRAVMSGAAAIFWMSTRPHLLLYRHTLGLDGQLPRRCRKRLWRAKMPSASRGSMPPVKK